MAIYRPDIRLAPSILSADFSRLGDEVRDVIAGGADWIHFDVMDNHFVPNLTIGPLILEAIRPVTKAPIDVHMMVENPASLISQFVKAGADYITIHAEADRHIDRTLGLIRDLGAKPGLVFNPATALDCLSYVIDKVDMVLLMSVNPGFGGQSFIPASLTKIAQVRQMVETHYTATGHEILVEVDGGVKPSNVADVVAAGANVVVAGSAVYGKRTATGYRDVISEMRAGMREGVRRIREAEELASMSGGD